jgi:hypothetical protein
MISIIRDGWILNSNHHHCFDDNDVTMDEMMNEG